jgi:hypothetical protein
MSHYPLLVIGEDPDAQLAPYSEHLDVEPYLDSVEGEWKDALIKATEYVTEHSGAYTKNWGPGEFLDSYYGVGYWTPVKGTGGFEHWSRYNPLSKWDWYVTGGRWEGFLRTRDGRAVNECTLGDLDLGEGFADRLPHAVLRNGGWVETGRMGWFGVVLDRTDDGEWERQVRAALEGLPPETRITNIDCHI